jgi:mono/diheme cytochrome c family protein
VIAALSTGHKTGLIAVAAIFIVFALVSSFVLPRRDPDFPGNRMGAFVGASVLLFVAMLAAIVIFGSEPKEKHAGEGPTTTDHITFESAAVAAQKGKALYAAKTCNSCHSVDGSFVAGPSFKGLAGSKVTLVSGPPVTADDAYLLESIEDPGKQVVKCPNCGPPSPMLALIKPHQISPQDAAELVAYIETLK